MISSKRKTCFALLSVFVLILFISSCKKDEEDCDKSTPGLGGTANVEGHVKHHDAPIPNARVFVKFGATEFPGTDTTGYDYVTTASSGDAHYHVDGIKPGDYYLYSVGYDSSISEAVLGGIGIEICEDGQLEETNIPVTE